MSVTNYLDHCPDCIPLPAQLPSSCLPVVVAALRDPANIVDKKCAVHCGLTLLAWGAGLWIRDHNPPHAGAAPVELDLAAAELEKAQLKSGVEALNWKMILSAVLRLVEQLINQ